MQFQSLIASQKVWVMQDSIYEAGVILNKQQQSKYLSVKLQGSNKTVKVAHKDCHTRAYKFKNYQDMCNMQTLNEAEIINNLLFRYQNNLIYTKIGTTLIAVNPYEILPNLYDNKNLLSIKQAILNNSKIQDIQPHIYVSAGIAFNKLHQNKIKQALIISGQSGAGKTQNTKYCMKFITSLSSNIIKKQTKKPIQEIILNSNPILECFGNAKTIRNNNSSRFGKFIKLFINQKSISGAKIQNYLLQKSRVTSVSKKQRSFHVFYSLIHKKWRRQGGLLEQEIFEYLQPGSLTAQGINDSSNFEVLRQALTDINLKQYEINKIFKALGGILLLGNLKFDSIQNEKNPNINCKYKNLELVQRICNNLQINQKQLDDMLLEQKRSIGKQIMIKRYNSSQCITNRNTVSKALYSRIFDYLVEKINTKLQTNQNDNKSIGILDIFGFEMFDHNSLEQLCINFTNERLQKLYTKYIFESEIQQLKKDGLQHKIKDISAPNNTSVIELIEKKVGISIFSLIDQKTTLGAAKDQDIIVQMRKIKNKHLYIDQQPNKTSFMILHTQSPVVYTVSQFKFKNQDSITPQIQLIIDRLFPILKNNDQKGKTLVTKFDKQLRSLNEELQSSQLHFIRCIKPNHTKQPMKLDQKYTLEQIKYMGILQTIQIRKNTFPCRQLYSNFVETYKCLITTNSEFSKLSLPQQSMGILRRLIPGIEKQKNSYQLGNQKIYLRDEHEIKLNDMILKQYQRKNKAASIIQHIVRVHQLRKHLMKNVRIYVRKMKMFKLILNKNLNKQNKHSFKIFHQQSKLKSKELKRIKDKSNSQQKLNNLNQYLPKISKTLLKYQIFLFFTKLKFSSEQSMYQTVTEYSTYCPPVQSHTSIIPKKQIVQSLLSVPNNYQSVILPPPNIKANYAFKGQICIVPYSSQNCNIQRLLSFISHINVYKQEDKQPWMSIDIKFSILQNLSKLLRSKFQNFIYMDFYEATLRKKRTVFGKYKKAMENLQYKGQPMKSSLLVLPPNEQKVAVEIFKILLTIGEEHKLNKIYESIQLIFNKIKNGSQTLKDQVFLQLLKQQNHTNQYSVIKMYQLTAILLHCQRISQDHLLAGLSCYLQRLQNPETSQRIKEYINQTFPKLLRQYQIKTDRQIEYFPAKYQVMALMSRRQISVSIFLSVGQQVVVCVQNFQTFEDIKQRVCLQAGINPERFISQIMTFIELINYENMEMKENPIDQKRKVWDLLTEWDLTCCQYQKQVKKPPVFIIMMKLRYAFQLSSNDIQGIQIVYSQCYFDLFLGKLTIPLELLYENSAIMKAVEPQTQLENIIPLMYMKDKETKQQYISSVNKIINSLQNKTRSELRFRFIKNCQSDNLCMATYYSTDNGIKIFLKLKKIILVDQNNNKEQIGIRRIKRWSIEGNMFSLILNQDKQRVIDIKIREQYGKVLSDNLTSNMKLIMQLQGGTVQ